MISESSEREYISVEQKNKILKFLLREFHIDFTRYSESSVRRRLTRLISDLRIKDIDDYLEYLRESEEGLDIFIDNFTVNVTEMFRDPMVYKLLRTSVFPRLFNTPGKRIWCAGCASGEEVVSLVILLKEEGLLQNTEIVGTDLSRNVLELAQKRRYRLRHIESAAPSYLDSGGSGKLEDYYQSYFHDEVIFNTDLFENVSYRQHNILKPHDDGLFDCICCRNLLIYFNPELQNNVLENLTNALKPGGILIIGAKESLVFYNNKNRFREVNTQLNIYQKIR